MTATPLLEGTKAVDGSKVRKMREALGLSRAELAVKAGVGVDLVGVAEREEANIRSDSLRAIVLALGVTADEVLR